jgi:hypothetical protein
MTAGHGLVVVVRSSALIEHTRPFGAAAVVVIDVVVGTDVVEGLEGQQIHIDLRSGHKNGRQRQLRG